MGKRSGHKKAIDVERIAAVGVQTVHPGFVFGNDGVTRERALELVAEYYTPEGILGRLAGDYAEANFAQQQLESTVGVARRAGLSWQRIADAMELPKDTVYSRYRDLATSMTEDAIAAATVDVRMV